MHSSKSAKKKIPDLRQKRYAAIHTSLNERPDIKNAYYQYLANNFNTSSLKDLSSEEFLPMVVKPTLQAIIIIAKLEIVIVIIPELQSQKTFRIEKV